MFCLLGIRNSRDEGFVTELGDKVKVYMLNVQIFSFFFLFSQLDCIFQVKDWKVFFGKFDQFREK